MSLWLPERRIQSKKARSSILIGDCKYALREIESESVSVCVTSPPYWGLRDYDNDAQIGAEASPTEYVANLVEVFHEARRTLREDGTLWLNIGDGYARNGGTGRSGPNAQVGNTKKLIQRRNCKAPDCWGLKDRDLMGLPWRVAFALQADGWILRSKIAWIKKAPMPESVRNRPSNATESIFLFSKTPNYYYDQTALEDTDAESVNYWFLPCRDWRANSPFLWERWSHVSELRGWQQSVRIPAGRRIRRSFRGSWRGVACCWAAAWGMSFSTRSLDLARRAWWRSRQSAGLS